MAECCKGSKGDDAMADGTDVKKGRVVLLAYDGSDHAKYALKCKWDH